MDQISGLAGPHASRPGSPPSADPRRSVAQGFEAAILAELLQAAGAAQPGGEFGGGIGEDQFASFLLHAQAQRMAERGGIGLAEMILRSMLAEAGPEGRS